MLERGELVRSPAPASGRRPRGVASIDEASVAERVVELEERRRERAEAAERRAVSGSPPADGRVWLDTGTVAAMVGLSRQWATLRAREGRIPATWHGGRWWVRREHAEQLAAARAALRQRC